MNAAEPNLALLQKVNTESFSKCGLGPPALDSPKKLHRTTHSCLHFAGPGAADPGEA